MDQKKGQMGPIDERPIKEAWVLKTGFKSVMFLWNRKGGGDGGVEGAVWGETLQQELYPTFKKA